MNDERQQILELLRERGPLTAEQIAAVLYPDGRGFLEDWDLSAESKVEMELERCEYAVELRTPNLWYATTPERAAELRKAARSAQAALLRELRAKDRAGELRDWDLLDLRGHEHLLRQKRQILRADRRPLAELIAEFNATLRKMRDAAARLGW